ncbi:T9SS type A sorting domain-containing protein [Chitinophaga nivalis]|uniref:T9SS type A sorting domain-containing protein n=1 Tax=Chitinophaga nivalis TaxID=2991709 RepID=A0ABT3IIW6_9BACT|nr:T9SS type A sorting domain-containing protein [Chitinophaga nivalis]MCW3466407.1 T9SS type A sorting domain-containing protein [Chitinophaga nivalis]MCW3483902.1 T9SS type A sorting domain-containing protein [Chitinophaga nivalis]
MIRFIRHFPFLLLFIIPLLTQSQHKISTFAAPVETQGFTEAAIAKEDQGFIYLAGQISDSTTGNKLPIPVILKMDAGGNTRWSYSINKETDGERRNAGNDGDRVNEYAQSRIKSLIIDSSYVFAALYNYYGDRGEFYEIRCLNKNTGDLVWRIKTDAEIKALNTTGGDYFIYSTSDYYGNYYILLDRHTGRQIQVQTHPVMARYEFDTDGSTYLIKGDTIARYSTPLLDHKVWEVKIATAYGTITSISLQPDGKLYFFGHNETRGFFGQVSKADGSTFWKQTPTALTDVFINSFKFVHDKLYVSGIHKYFGSVFSAFSIVAADAASGQVLIDKTYTGKGASPYFGINSVDADVYGNVYASGYENANDSRTGSWAVLKLSPNGSFIYHKLVENGEPKAYGAQGLLTRVINNQVVHIGNLSMNGRIRTLLIATDTSATFQPRLQQLPVATIQYGSAVKVIRNFSANAYAILKQTGNHATLEYINTDNKNFSWSRKIDGGAYVKADRMAITADKQIVILTQKHKASSALQDYRQQPDSAYITQFDSIGTVTKDYSYYIGDRKDFKSIQLYTSPDTNTVVVFSQVDFYKSPLSTHFFNPARASERMGGDWQYIASPWVPLPGNQQVLFPMSRDSSGMMRTTRGSDYYPASSSYRTYVFNENNQAGIKAVQWHKTSSNYAAHNLAVCDSNSILSLGKDAQQRAVIKRYNYRKQVFEWEDIQPKGSTIEQALVSDGKVYWAGKRDRSLIIRKLDSQTGNGIWEKEAATTGANQYYVPLDQAYNPIRQQYVVTGYIADTSVLLAKQKPFYVIIDSAGTVVQNWTSPADYRQFNQLNSVAITAAGQTIIGGSLYKDPNGLAGILIEADKPILPPTEQVVTPCESTSFTLDAGTDGTAYQWQADNGSGYVNLTNNATVNGVNNRILHIVRTPASWNGTRFRCLVNNNSDIIFRLAVSVSTPASVHITASDTLIKAGNPVTFTATPSNATNCTYQWMINNTAAGNGQPVFTLSPDKDITVLVKMTGEHTCTGSLIAANSNTIRVSVQPAAAPDPATPVAYPNPVSNTVMLDLRPEDKWESLEIMDLQGNRQLLLPDISNRLKVSIPVPTLNAGIYIIKLQSGNGYHKSSRFIKQ